MTSIRKEPHSRAGDTCGLSSPRFTGCSAALSLPARRLPSSLVISGWDGPLNSVSRSGHGSWAYRGFSFAHRLSASTWHRKPSGFVCDGDRRQRDTGIGSETINGTLLCNLRKHHGKINPHGVEPGTSHTHNTSAHTTIGMRTSSLFAFRPIHIKTIIRSRQSPNRSVLYGVSPFFPSCLSSKTPHSTHLRAATALCLSNMVPSCTMITIPTLLSTDMRIYCQRLHRITLGPIHSSRARN